MPRGDGTGPAGKGPATGRGLGGCKPKKPSDKEKDVRLIQRRRRRPRRVK